MGKKITDYTNTRNTFDNADEFDCSAFLNPGYESQKTTWTIIKANLATAGFASSNDNISIFTNDSGYLTTIPTHTGEVTGGTALVVDSTAISNKTLVTGVSGDMVLIEDATDGLLKRVDVLDFLGSGSGILGIADAAGEITYYSTLQLAIDAASDTDVIQVYTDIIATTTITLTTSTTRNINFNGHTYTLDTTSDISAFTLASGGVTLNFFNGKIVRRNATTPNDITHGIFDGISTLESKGMIYNCEDGSVGNIANCYGGKFINGASAGTGLQVFEAQNIEFEATGGGQLVLTDSAAYNFNIHAISYGGTCLNMFSGVKIHNSTIIAVAGKCVKGTSSGSVFLYDCDVLCQTTNAFSGGLTIENTNVNVLAGTPSTIGTILNSTVNYTASFTATTIIGSTINKTTDAGTAFVINGTATIINSTIKSNQLVGGGGLIGFNSNGLTHTITNSYFEAASGPHIFDFSVATINLKLANCSIKGVTAIVEAGVVITTANTQDSFGNLII